MFAKIMIKYVLGILFCAFLLLGLQQKTDVGLQKLRLASAATTQNAQLQFRALSNNYSISKSTVKRTSNKKDIFGMEMFSSEVGDCMLESFTHFRCRTVPTRLLKDFIIAAAKRLFHSSNVQRVENKYQGLSPHTNYIKFSNRYYVYTLEHILI